MTELADQTARGWEAGQRIDVAEEMSRLTGAIALRTLFGAGAIRDQDAYNTAHITALSLIHERINRTDAYHMHPYAHGIDAVGRDVVRAYVESLSTCPTQ